MTTQAPSKEQMQQHLTDLLYSLHLQLDVNNSVPERVSPRAGSTFHLREWLNKVRNSLHKFEETFRASNEPPADDEWCNDCREAHILLSKKGIADGELLDRIEMGLAQPPVPDQHYKQRLRDLLPYSGHRETCNYVGTGRPPCDCGFAALYSIAHAEVGHMPASHPTKGENHG